MMSASQILADLETLVFDREKKVMPQVEQLTINALFSKWGVSEDEEDVVDEDDVVSLI